MTPMIDRNLKKLYPKNILLLTNHLYEWAGSEMIIVELAEAYSARGAQVTIFANDISDEFIHKLVNYSFRVMKDSSNINLAEFDLIYCQHQVITKFLDQLLELDDAERPALLYAHLSPYGPLELPGPVVEPHFADLVVYNSPETGAKIKELGLDQNKSLLMPNPAPDAFFDVEDREGPLKRLLVVSNHLPKELSAALLLLEIKGVKVTRRGIKSRNVRITPRDLAEHDAVVSIGKTVQYSLAAGRPVYVYDRFGGPGWLVPANLKNAGWYNFSGRCCNLKLSPAKLASEILNGFLRSQNQRIELRQAAEEFRLSSWIEKTLLPAAQYQIASRSQVPRGLDEEVILAMRRESVMHLLAVDNRREARRAPLRDGVIPPVMQYSTFAYRVLYFLSRIGPKESRRGFRVFYKAMKAIRGKRG